MNFKLQVESISLLPFKLPLRWVVRRTLGQGLKNPAFCFYADATQFLALPSKPGSLLGRKPQCVMELAACDVCICRTSEEGAVGRGD